MTKVSAERTTFTALRVDVVHNLARGAASEDELLPPEENAFHACANGFSTPTLKR
jgi:hypothetical protein